MVRSNRVTIASLMQALRRLLRLDNSCLARCDKGRSARRSRRRKVTTYRLKRSCAVVAILALAALLSAGAAAGDVGIVRGLFAARHGWRWSVLGNPGGVRLM
jgi:hypothetical protein